MAKLDALPWAGGVSFVCCGVRLGVRVDDRAVLDELSPYLPPLRDRCDAPLVDHLFSLRTRCDESPRESPRTRLYEGARCITRPPYLAPSMQLDVLRSRLEYHVASGAASRLFVHAGVVEWGGRAIVIPGRSRSGKTSLVLALVRAGARYYSDEFALLDEFGRVHPWPRPLRIRRPDLPPQLHPVETLGGRRSERRSLPLGLIVVTAYRDGAKWQPRLLSRGQVLLALMQNTLAARTHPDRTLRILARAVRGARGLKSRRGDGEALAAALLSDEVAAAGDAEPRRRARQREAV